MAFLWCLTLSSGIFDPPVHILRQSDDKRRREQRHVDLFDIFLHLGYLHSDLPIDDNLPLLHLAEPFLYLLPVPRHLLRVRLGL